MFSLFNLACNGFNTYNSLDPGRCGSNFKIIIWKIIIQNSILGIVLELPQMNAVALSQCRPATNHSRGPNQCWLRSMTPYVVSRPQWVVNSSPLDKMAAISQTTFSNLFSWMKRFELLLKFYWSLFVPKVQFNNQALAEIMAWRRIYATSQYLNHCWPDSLTHICGTRGTS